MIFYMNHNILSAILNIKAFGDNDLADYSSRYLNRINAVGDQLEFYVKDAFADSFLLNQNEKEFSYSRVFSYLGNQNNPPDAILRGNDAIEVKKLQGMNTSHIPLNSSYPKSKLHSDSHMITTACRDCEQEGWDQKDMIYAVGNVVYEKIKVLIFIYGDCYAASNEVYERVREAVKSGISSEGIEFSETRELGRVNRVDPLGITYLRIRGMWGIQSPIKLFENELNYDQNSDFTVFAIMKSEKYNSFPEDQREAVENELEVSDIVIRNPDNPARL